MSIVRNTGYNLLSSIVPIFISIVTVPMYIHAIGEARYGVVALIGLLLGYFGVFDFGLSIATAQRIASTDPAAIDMRRRILWTALGVNLALGLLGAAILLPVSQVYVTRFLKTSSVLLPEMRHAMGWLALALPVSLLTNVLRGALQGANRFGELNLINVVVGPLGQLATVAVALWISPSLDAVLPALYITRVAFLACYAVVIARSVTRGWTPTFDRGLVRDLLGFGSWVTISSLISPMMTMLDRFLIGSLISASAVSFYTVPYQLAERTLILPGALLQAMFPKVAAANDHQAVALSRRGMRALGAAMGPIAVGGIVFMHPFLTLWIGARFADQASTSGQVLLAGFWFNAQGMCSVVRLQAAGRPRLIALAHTIEVLPYFAVLALFMHLFGLVGAAFAFTLRVLVDNILLAWFADLLGETVRLSLVAISVLTLAIWVGSRMEFEVNSRLFTGVGLTLAVSVIALAWIHSQRETLLNAMRSS